MDFSEALTENIIITYHLFEVKIKKQARKGFRPISASEVLLVRKLNNLINKRMEHWSCRIFVQQVK